MHRADAGNVGRGGSVGAAVGGAAAVVAAAGVMVPVMMVVAEPKPEQHRPPEPGIAPHSPPVVEN